MKIFLNTKNQMIIGALVLSPGLNELDSEQVKALKRTNIGKHLFDRHILDEVERDADNLYKIPTPEDSEKFLAKAGKKTAKPEGKVAGKAMSPDGTATVEGGDLPLE